MSSVHPESEEWVDRVEHDGGIDYYYKPKGSTSVYGIDLEAYEIQLVAGVPAVVKSEKKENL